MENLSNEVASRDEMVEIIPLPDEVREMDEKIPAGLHRKLIFVFAADGVGWIWDTVQSLFPDCRQVLDSFRCSQHLHDVAHVHFGENTRARQWIEQTNEQLFDNTILESSSASTT